MVPFKLLTAIQTRAFTAPVGALGRSPPTFVHLPLVSSRKLALMAIPMTVPLLSSQSTWKVKWKASLVAGICTQAVAR